MPEYVDAAALGAAWCAGIAGACATALMLGRLWDFAKRVIR
jgi:hypothetical protein